MCSPKAHVLKAWFKAIVLSESSRPFRVGLLRRNWVMGGHTGTQVFSTPKLWDEHASPWRVTSNKPNNIMKNLQGHPHMAWKLNSESKQIFFYYIILGICYSHKNLTNIDFIKIKKCSDSSDQCTSIAIWLLLREHRHEERREDRETQCQYETRWWENGTEGELPVGQDSPVLRSWLMSQECWKDT